MTTRLAVNPNQASNQPQTNSSNISNQAENDFMIVVDFLKIDTSKFSFGKPKKNDHGSLDIPIRYDGKILYPKFPKRRLPFGITKSFTVIKAGEPEFNVYPDNKKLTGMTASFSFGKDKETCATDPYFLKAQELDEFFIKKCAENSLAWGQAGAPEAVFRGYDQHGFGGKYKRMVKPSYKVNPDTQQRIYTDHPPRFEMSVWANLSNTPDSESGKMIRGGPITTALYDKDGKKLNDVTTENVNNFIPKFCEGSSLACLKKMNSSAFGISCKMTGMQIRSFTSDKLLTECILNDDDDESGNAVPSLISDDGLNGLNLQPVVPNSVHQISGDTETYDVDNNENENQTVNQQQMVQHPQVQVPMLPQPIQQTVQTVQTVQQVKPRTIVRNKL